jgi:hypothetical protein
MGGKKPLDVTLQYRKRAFFVFLSTFLDEIPSFLPLLQAVFGLVGWQKRAMSITIYPAGRPQPFSRARWLYLCEEERACLG